MKIDFVSDVSCPWCAIGLSALKQALERLGDEVPVELHFQPFEINPHMPPEGEDTGEHLTRKYGLTPEQIERNGEVLRQRGEAVGFSFGKRRRIYNTFDAHRLPHWAGLEGRQREFKHALLRAYFTDGGNLSDRALLARIAGEVGLDAQRARAILASDEYAAELRECERFYLDRGIHAVLSVIVDDNHLIQGGQPVEMYERALRRLAMMA